MTTETKQASQVVAFWPVQCSCGHVYLEKYQFAKVTDRGHIGFCWCGWCRKKVMVKPAAVEKMR